MRFHYTRCVLSLRRLHTRLAPLLGVRDTSMLALAASRSMALRAAIDAVRRRRRVPSRTAAVQG